jgi:hypothetical protein
MSFRNNINKHKLWQECCINNHDLITSLKLPEWVFSNEKNFRDFASKGLINEENLECFKFIQLKINEPKLFCNLFKFIDYYFGLDAGYFDKFEEARIS